MQYITKLAKSQSQKPRSPLTQYMYNVMYPVGARVRTVKNLLKIYPAHKIVLRGLCHNLQPLKGSLTRDFQLQVFS
jgi:hypothetical protein